jgi:hypothetical protein
MPRACTAALFPLAALLATAEVAAANDTYSFTVNPGSSFTTTLDANAAISGTLLGSFDATANPGGTKTRTGSDFLFGSCSGNTNTSFPFTASGSVPTTAATTSPSGAFTFVLDAEALSGTLTGLMLDLLNGAHPTFPVDASLTNPQTFRTCAPRALWPASTIPFDLGDATLDTLTAVQTATVATGPLVVLGPNQYGFATTVEVTVTALLTLSGQAVTPDPLVVTLPIAFVVTVSESGASINLSVDTTVSFETTKPVPGPVDQPLDIPTVLPPGSTAHFLTTTTITSSTTNLAVDGSASATGVKPFSRADWNRDGVVNSTDVSDFINDWFADQVSGGLTTDFNNDGVSNSTDVSDFINVWFEEA